MSGTDWEARFRELEARYRAMVELAPEAICVLDVATGKFVEANPEAHRLFAAEGDELFNHGPIALSPERQPNGELSAELGMAYVKQAIDSGVHSFEWTHTTLSGEPILCRVQLAPVISDRGVFVRGSFRDIRGQKELERKVQHAQKLESLGVLAGGIAHDFNNILIGILVNAALALEHAPSGEARELIADIEKAAKRASDLAQQMLVYAGQNPVSPIALQLDELVADVANPVSASLTGDARLIVDHAADLPAIAADPGHLRQVLMNLISNAAEGLEDERGEIRVSTAVAQPEVGRLLYNYLPSDTDLSRCVRLEVADTGKGIEAHLVERIFDPFFTTKFAGRGLGLAAVVGIVRVHNGAIEVETDSGAGTRFRVWFAPAREPSPAAPRSRPESKAKPDTGTVLIIDDEDLVRRAMRRVVRAAGFDVLEAANGEEGLRLFREAPEVCGVLLDLTMPGRSGHEVLRDLRDLQADVPVVLTSGYSDTGALANRADAFLAKPFTAEELEALIRRLFA